MTRRGGGGAERRGDSTSAAGGAVVGGALGFLPRAEQRVVRPAAVTERRARAVRGERRGFKEAWL